MPDARAILQHIAVRAMIDYGLEPELPPQAAAEVQHLRTPAIDGLVPDGKFFEFEHVVSSCSR